MWFEDDYLPQDLKDARIVQLHKGKGEKSCCVNYQAGKILYKVILKRLNTYLQKGHYQKASAVSPEQRHRWHNARRKIDPKET